ncbi:anthranilate synthase component II [Candidatus Harpocratesius sp.]
MKKAKKQAQKILFINNMDSFTYNLVHDLSYIGNVRIQVVSNQLTIEEIERISPDKLIISPGPGHPKYDSGNLINIIQKLYKKLPIFGVCMGFQVICEAFGQLENGEKAMIEYVGRAKVGPMHGKMSNIFHNGTDILKNLPNPLKVIRYHSLAAKPELFPNSLLITGMASDGTIMALKHKKYPVFGVQFHPESIAMRPYGFQILKNFLNIKYDFNKKITKIMENSDYVANI